MVKAAVLAASGYIGGELLRLLIQHPDVEVVAATSRASAGEYVFRVHPNLRGVSDLKFSAYDGAKTVAGADVVFAALPHGESLRHIPEIAATGVRVVDLSADFRLRDPEKYRMWYGRDHPSPDLLERFVFSVPELNREEVKQARLVSSPGCMAITSILALTPLLKTKGLGIDRDHIVVDAKVGSSGSGGKPSVSTHFSERFNVVRPYKAAGHRHSAEVEQVAESVAGEKVRVSMSAHAVNMVRGILCTCHVFTRPDVEAPEVWKAYRACYSGSPFIRLVRDRQGPFRLPDPKLVIGSNFCDVGFETEARTGRLVALAATDNLVKGAAGNAVQSMNLMMGLDEKAGLGMAPLHPV
jgi:N-acetyl-gamma-glutamyl-phosphate/LysW-gamma-L-alpha-aminoadipyl-6-phosphate reductase